MLRKTYLIQNSAYISLEHDNLKISKPSGETIYRPIDDMDSLILDHAEVSITLPCLRNLIQNSTDVLICDDKHLPRGMFVPLYGHSMMSYRCKLQVTASKPLVKNIWKLMVRQKIQNQALLLNQIGAQDAYLTKLISKVKSGDITNKEAMAASYYWKHIFGGYEDEFKRNPDGIPPNNLLNYGYAILRSLTARSLVAAGLWPLFGVHHSNRYNPLPLADDIMEPFRPVVDSVVLQMCKNEIPEILDTHHKTSLLSLNTVDVIQDKVTRPLQVAIQATCSSLAKVFETKNINHLSLPTLKI